MEYEAVLVQIENLLSIPTWVQDELSVPILRLDPRWDPLRSHPRFQQILEKYAHCHIDLTETRPLRL